MIIAANQITTTTTTSNSCTWWYRTLLLVVVAMVGRAGGVILTHSGGTAESDHRLAAAVDVTEMQEFGCRWLGGSDSKLVCQCQSDAQEIVINVDSIPARDIGAMSISDCRRSVRFNSHAISRMRNLRYIEIRDSTLHFAAYSFLWEGYVFNDNNNNDRSDNNNNGDEWNYSPTVPTLKVIIDRCHVTEIGSYAFQGRISEISVTNSVIDDVGAFAWSQIRSNNKFQIINSRIVNIAPQALKKFSTAQLTLDSVQFDSLPSRTLSDVTVHDLLLLRNVTANRIRSSAFTVSGPKRTELIANRFDVVEGGAFRMYTRGGVTVKNNDFKQVQDYAFKEISVDLDRVTGRQYIEFTNNTIADYYRDSLSVNGTSFDVKYSDIVLKLPCDCTDINRLFQQHDGSGDDDDGMLGQFSCRYNSDGGDRSISEFKRYKCTALASHSNLFIILGVTGIVLVLVMVGLALYFKKVHRCGSYGGADDQLGADGDKDKKSLGLIVPDGRTYRETELHVIVERTDLLTTDL